MHSGMFRQQVTACFLCDGKQAAKKKCTSIFLSKSSLDQMKINLDQMKINLHILACLFTNDKLTCENCPDVITLVDWA